MAPEETSIISLPSFLSAEICSAKASIREVSSPFSCEESVELPILMMIRLD